MDADACCSPAIAVDWSIYMSCNSLSVNLLSLSASQEFTDISTVDRTGDIGIRTLWELADLFTATHVSYRFLRQDFHFIEVQGQALLSGSCTRAGRFFL